MILRCFKMKFKVVLRCFNMLDNEKKVATKKEE
jgi:hypothetical protein